MILSKVAGLVEILNDNNIADKEHYFNMCLKETYTVTKQSDEISDTFIIKVTYTLNGILFTETVTYNNLLGDITIQKTFSNS